jgi:hypothetical protein
MKLTCLHCGHSTSFPDKMPAQQVNAKLQRMRQDVLSKQLDESGSVKDGQRLLQQRRQRPGMKPIWTGG